MRSPVTVRLYPEAIVTGTLSAPDGTPLPRIFVTAQRSTYTETGHQWMPTAQATTNSRGEFRLTVPPGDYRIETAFLQQVPGTGKMLLPLIYPSGSSSLSSASIHLRAGAEEHLELRPHLRQSYNLGLRIDP